MKRPGKQLRYLKLWTNCSDSMHLEPVTRPRPAGCCRGMAQASSRCLVAAAPCGGDRYDAGPGTLDVARNGGTGPVRAGIVVRRHLHDADHAEWPGRAGGLRRAASAVVRQRHSRRGPRADHRAHRRGDRAVPAGNLHRAAAPAAQRRRRRRARLPRRPAGERELPHRAVQLHAAAADQDPAGLAGLHAGEPRHLQPRHAQALVHPQDPAAGTGAADRAPAPVDQGRARPPVRARAGDGRWWRGDRALACARGAAPPPHLGRRRGAGRGGFRADAGARAAGLQAARRAGVRRGGGSASSIWAASISTPSAPTGCCSRKAS